MVCGTGSDSGKSTLVAGICRLLAREGMRVAPFKAQNMSLNSAVTASGHEIGRAQAAQAEAAGVPAEAAMNPILIKPTDDRTSQVIVDGRVWRTLDARSYQQAKEDLWPLVMARLADLRSRFDAVICEGAGSPAEINLLAHDITNLRVAQAAGLPAILVGDIDRGGVFASLYGTVSILLGDLGATVRGFVINKFRGDPSILAEGLTQLERLSGRSTLGVIPWMSGLGIDAEDSMSLHLDGWAAQLPGVAPWHQGAVLDVAVVGFPRISNFTDIEALRLEPAVGVRFVYSPGTLGQPHLVILPGTKSTVSDLAWLRASGLADAIGDLAPGVTVLGICGGYQMLGVRITDPVEAPGGADVSGLGLLDVKTTFEDKKVTRQVIGTSFGHRVVGYEIHHGRSCPAVLGGPQRPWIRSEHGQEGSRSASGKIFGTAIHGLFEEDGFRRAFLADVARRAGVPWNPGPPVSFSAARQARFDRVADAIEQHLDTAAIRDLIDGAKQ
jgi:adenosylcobyric acid synthase